VVDHDGDRLLMIGNPNIKQQLVTIAERVPNPDSAMHPCVREISDPNRQLAAPQLNLQSASPLQCGFVNQQFGKHRQNEGVLDIRCNGDVVDEGREVQRFGLTQSEAGKNLRCSPFRRYSHRL
jgi:hypothetical protein